MEGVGGRANFANTGQLISSHWIKPIDRGSAGERGRFRELKLIRRGVSSFRLRRDPSTRFFRSRRGFVTLWRRKSIRSGKTGQIDSSCSCDFEALGRVTPATSISELSVYFLRKCKKRCRVLGSRYKFFGGVTMAGVKVIARSRHAADTCTRDKRMDRGRLLGKWTKYFLYIFHR